MIELEREKFVKVKDLKICRDQRLQSERISTRVYHGKSGVLFEFGLGLSFVRAA